MVPRMNRKLMNAGKGTVLVSGLGVVTLKPCGHFCLIDVFLAYREDCCACVHPMGWLPCVLCCRSISKDDLDLIKLRLNSYQVLQSTTSHIVNQIFRPSVIYSTFSGTPR